MPFKVLFVRHGESQANLDQVFANRVTIPGDLTAEGRAQATALGFALKPLGISRIYSSPLPRALQTAAHLAEILDAPVTITDELREYDVGDFEGLPYSGDHAWRWERYEAIELTWRNGHLDARHPGGESLADLKQRMLRFMSGLASRHDTSETVVAVGHGGLFRVVFPHIFDNLPSGYAWQHPIRHGDVIAAVHDGDAWSCLRWGKDRFPATG